MMKRKMALILIVIIILAAISLSGYKSPMKYAAKKLTLWDHTKNTNTPTLAGGPEKKHRYTTRTKIIMMNHQYPYIIYYKGSNQKKQMALTFDDGPDNYFTPQILDILKREKVHATFFVVGKRAEANPQIVKRMYREGHIIGNHTWDHPFLTKLSAAKRYSEIKDTENEIFQITHYKTWLFRAPYGELNEDIIKQIDGMGYKIIAWSVDTVDWKGLKSGQIEAIVFSHAENGSIILQHCAGGKNEDLSGTVKALPRIIEYYRREGFSFVTIPELLNLLQ